MSDEKVAMVRKLQPPPEIDLVRAFRSDQAFAALLRPVLGPRLHPNAESVIVMPGDDPRNPLNLHRGLDGFRDAWLDWTAPWESYYCVEVEDMIDLGESILVVIHDRGRLRGASTDVDSQNAAIWTVRDGLVVRAEFYAERRHAFEAAGLSRLDKLERLRAVYSEWAHGNFLAGQDLLASDVTFLTFTTEGDDLTYHGPQGVREYMRDFLQTWTDLQVEASDFRESGERVLAICHQRAKGRQSGVAVEMPLYAVWTFRHEQVVRLHWLRDHDEAFRAVGLPP